MTGRRVLAGALLGVVLLGAPLAAQAADSEGRTMVVGTGLDPCTIVQFGGTLTVVGMAWVAGYLTAVNDLTPETVSITGSTDAGGAFAWIGMYCAMNPLHTLLLATRAYAQAAYPARLTRMPDTVLPSLPTPAPTPARKQALRPRAERY